MYTKQILGGWDLQESDFATHAEWVRYKELHSPEFHTSEAVRLAALDEKKRQEAVALREKVVAVAAALSEGESITFSRKTTAPSGAVRLINLEIAGKPFPIEVLSVNSLSYFCPAFTKVEAEVIAKGFAKKIGEAAGIADASRVETRNVDKRTHAYDVF